MNDLLLGLHTDPFLTTVVVGMVWPMIQAALDRPYWMSGTYPATWRLLIAQAGVFLGIAWSAFQVLSAIRVNGVSLIDWVGAVTPGGESVEEVRAAADSVPSTRVVDGTEPASRD
mgnify:CR=1 FL=1